MALIAHYGAGARTRWTLAALLGRLPAPSPAVIREAAEADAKGRRRRTRRHYRRQHDSLFEQSAMAREMFRL